MWDREATERKVRTSAGGRVVGEETAGQEERDSCTNSNPGRLCRPWGRGCAETLGTVLSLLVFDVYSEWPDDKLEVAGAIVVLFVPYFGGLSENVVPFPQSGMFSKFFGLLLLIGF